MNKENIIFKKYKADFDKLKEYGFKKEGKNYTIEKLFKDDLFKAFIEINSKGEVLSKVFDVENDDEFLPFRIENNQGAFVNSVRASYNELLIDIREKCFKKDYFSYPQSNRITNLIFEKYKIIPEFLWEKFDGSGIFRNSKTKKWFLAILEVKGEKFNSLKKTIEVADLKLPPDKIQSLLKEKDYYPAYHMNKKHWITVILDNSLSDERLMELIDFSFELSKNICK